MTIEVCEHGIKTKTWCDDCWTEWYGLWDTPLRRTKRKLKRIIANISANLMGD